MVPKSTKSGKKSKKKSEIDESKRDKVKEKTYVVKQVETSMKLLECDEDEVVLDALLFLSKYSDLQINNLNYIQVQGISSLLLKLLNRNICIKRLSLRLLDLILTNSDFGIYEIDQEAFDEDILKICELYCTEEDPYVKEFTLHLLERLATTTRSPALIFKVDLLKPINETLETSKNQPSIEYTLKLFSHLTDAPNVLVALAEPANFDPTLLLKHMKTFEPTNTKLILDILEKITHESIDELQKRLKEVNLVEQMIDIIVDDQKEEYRPRALDIVNHCVDNEETNTYFTSSKQFLKLSLWIRTCSNEYIITSAEIFEKLSDIPSIRQLLLDLYVVDSIMHFLRSTDKTVLNSTCRAISNLSTHKYCCERMITPIVVKSVLNILKRNDKTEDQHNEIALKTIHELTMRNATMLDMIHEYKGIPILKTYLEKGMEKLEYESYLRVLEITNLLINSYYSEAILNSQFYILILDHFRKYHYEEASLRLVELMIYCLKQSDFRSFMLINELPEAVIERLNTDISEQLLKFLCVFIFNSLVYKNIALSFIEAKLLIVLKNKSDILKERIPLINRVITTAYDICLPLKFFETGKLEVMDKLRDCFYVISGQWHTSFPFLEILEMEKVSTINTIYVVRNIAEPISGSLGSLVSSEGSSFLGSNTDQERRSTSEGSKQTSFDDSTRSEITEIIHYGKLSLDPYIYFYLAEITNKLKKVVNMEERIHIVAEYVDQQLCGPSEELCLNTKLHKRKLHIESLKAKLGTNMIPIGYVRIGFHLERALLFKFLADKVFIPATLQKGSNDIYWNEIALIVEEDSSNNTGRLKYFVVDLMKTIGRLMLRGSREANEYCKIKY